MVRRDYIERMIEQLAAAVAKVMALAAEGKPEEAEAELEGAWSAGPGCKRADASRLDDATLRLLLGPKVALAASLFEAEATIADARADASSAAQLRARAASLRH